MRFANEYSRNEKNAVGSTRRLQANADADNDDKKKKW